MKPVEVAINIVFIILCLTVGGLSFRYMFTHFSSPATVQCEPSFEAVASQLASSSQQLVKRHLRFPETAIFEKPTFQVQDNLVVLNGRVTVTLNNGTDGINDYTVAFYKDTSGYHVSHVDVNDTMYFHSLPALIEK